MGPPFYYGDRCDYQNQHISFTFGVRTFSWNSAFGFLVLLVDNDSSSHAHEQLDYLAARDCQSRFDVNLLYKTRPKNVSKVYTVQIYAFDRNGLFTKPRYVPKWKFPIRQPPPPVYRLSVSLVLPVEQYSTSKTCSTHRCVHGHCQRDVHTGDEFCHCAEGWRGLACEKPLECQCASDSLCIETSICLFSLGKVGRRCVLTNSACRTNLCQHDGLCVPNDVRWTSRIS